MPREIGTRFGTENSSDLISSVRGKRQGSPDEMNGETFLFVPKAIQLVLTLSPSHKGSERCLVSSPLRHRRITLSSIPTEKAKRRVPSRTLPPVRYAPKYG